MILTNILQISTDTTRTLSDETLLGTQNTVNVIDIAMKGGWIMVILLALSILAIYVFTNRILLLRKAMKNPEVILEKVKTAVKNGDLETATIVCRDEDTPAARMIMAGLNNITSSLKNIEAAIENVGKIEIYRLEKNVSILATISGAAPMIGFFGTVLGMIQAFISIAQEEGSVSPKLLSSGIYEAMVTTAGGLFVGIIAYICYNYIVRQISNVVYNVEITSIEFMNLLQNPE